MARWIVASDGSIMPADSTSSFINAKSMSPAWRALADYVMGLKAGGRKLNVPHVQQPLHHGLTQVHVPKMLHADRVLSSRDNPVMRLDLVPGHRVAR